MSYNRRLVSGVGTNDADYTTSPVAVNGVRTRCPFYVKWLDMLTRCYSDKYKKSLL